MKTFSQNDARWKDDKHGSSTSTIGKTGCTITGLTMLLVSIGYDETPKTVDDKLTANGGYASGNLILWQTIEKIWPRAKFRWRGYTYTDDDNAKIADAIKKYGGCLVAVNGTPIGGVAKDGHWVVYIGNKTLIDPWDGKEKPTSSYAATGYSIIELIQGAPEGTTIPVDTKTFEELVSKATKYDAFKNSGYENATEVAEDISAMKESISALEETVTNLNQLVADKNNTVSKMQSQISSLDSQLLEMTSRVESLTEQAKKLPELQKEYDHLLEQKTKWAEAEKTYNRQIGQLKQENEELRKGSLQALFKVILDKIISRFKKKGGKQ